jgi:hypothetical protein
MKGKEGRGVGGEKGKKEGRRGEGDFTQIHIYVQSFM